MRVRPPRTAPPGVHFPSRVLARIDDRRALPSGAGTRGEIPKVLDFGIVKLLGPGWHESSILTGPDTFLGTPRYMAPEQVIPGANVDHRADVWALGAILYECLSGCAPLDGSNSAAVIRSLLGGAIVPLENLIAVPDGLAGLVSRMLDRDRDQRPLLRDVHPFLARAAGLPPEDLPDPLSRPLPETPDEDDADAEEAPVAVRRPRGPG